ncbi:MAG: PIN domain-containing protein [Acidobacteriota bacterium]|jgi:predicted nucleic acid-binding protein|nr:type II toxin-antitoxin system VapC family toxin [Acidobacteriota bacterium]MDQ3374197.1 PIN domain-containing protein [Acidobacteriota bacterium]
MKKIFADAVYWIALINPADQWFERAQNVAAPLGKIQIVTTVEILTETLNFYAESGTRKRDAAAQLIRSILLNVDVEVVAATNEAFLDALTLYESRRDKGYSLTDCISMNGCRTREITEILTHDNHFEQEGFTVLL